MTMKRVLLFCIIFPWVLIFGTFSVLDAEGRSERLWPKAAAKYAWQLAE